MNFANILTLFRVATVPVIIYFIYQDSFGFSLAGIFLLFLAFLSDSVDGYIARKTNRVTRIGSFLDPFADKLLVVCLLFVYFLRDSFSIYYLSIFILRDIVFNLFRAYASREDLDIKQEKKYSKIVINSQFILVFTLLLQDLFVNGGYQGISFTETLVTIFTIVAIIVAIASVLMYWFIYSRLVGNKKRLGKLVKNEKMVVLANRKSRGYRDGYRRRLLRKFSRRRRTRIIYLPQNDNMYRGILKKIKSAKHIIIAGGDGSFESALNYKPFWKKALGFFPFGAGNAYYAYFFKGKRFEYLRSRFKFREVLMDVLELEYNGKTTQTTFLSAGIDSEVPRLADESQHGLKGYIKASYIGVSEAKGNYNFEIKVDGRKQSLKNCVTLTLAKIPYFGYNIRSLLGKTEMDDGKVYGLAVVNRHTRFANKAIRVWSLLLTALNMERDPLMSLKGKEFIIECKEPFPLQAGGEFLDFTQKIKVKVVRQQKVLMI